MERNTLLTCPACGTVHTTVLLEPSLLACKNCREIVYADPSLEIKPSKTAVPEDWNILQIGTTGGYNQNHFTVVGRIRLQLRNDYKNLWCAALNDGVHIWIMESFASVSILGSTWSPFEHAVKKLHAGKTVELKNAVKLTGEYVEKCESISYEGEVGKWKLFQRGFFFIQFSNNDHHTAVFVADRKRDIEYLQGGKVDIEKLNLKNTVTLDEWK